MPYILANSDRFFTGILDNGIPVYKVVYEGKSECGKFYLYNVTESVLDALNGLDFSPQKREWDIVKYGHWFSCDLYKSMDDYVNIQINGNNINIYYDGLKYRDFLTEKFVSEELYDSENYWPLGEKFEKNVNKTFEDKAKLALFNNLNCKNFVDYAQKMYGFLYLDNIARLFFSTCAINESINPAHLFNILFNKW